MARKLDIPALLQALEDWKGAHALMLAAPDIRNWRSLENAEAALSSLLSADVPAEQAWVMSGWTLALAVEVATGLTYDGTIRPDFYSPGGTAIGFRSKAEGEAFRQAISGRRDHEPVHMPQHPDETKMQMMKRVLREKAGRRTRA